MSIETRCTQNWGICFVHKYSFHQFKDKYGTLYVTRFQNVMSNFDRATQRLQPWIEPE